MKNKITKILIILSLFGALTFSGCSSSGGSKTVDIFWEDVEITINQVSKIPSEFDETYNQYSLQYEITGSPNDNFYTGDSLDLISVYDENGNQCSLLPISGMNKDLLVVEKIEVVGLIGCRQSTDSELQFIFRDSTNEISQSVAGKVFKEVEKSPISEVNNTLVSYYDSKEEYEDEENNIEINFN